MSWAKTAVGTLTQVDTQTDPVVMPVGGISIAGTESSIPNPLRGARMWDTVAITADNIAAADGSWTITVVGSVAGIGNFPFARRIVDSTQALNPQNGTSSMALISCNNTPYMLCPTGVSFTETASGGITCTVTAIARTEKGEIPGGTLNPARVNEGIIAEIPLTRWAGEFAGATGGITASGGAKSINMALSNTTATGTTAWGLLGGLGHLHLWDETLYFMDVTGASGAAAWGVYVQGQINGSTITVAGVSGIGAATVAAGAGKYALTNTFHGAGVRPNNILFRCTASGASCSIAGTIVYAAKTRRGRRYKA